jgi:ABC-type multidrug transport system ATPase subunit
MSGDCLVEASELVKDYGSFRAVDGLNLSVSPGSVLGFLGPNGAGKSTTLRMLVDLIRPSSGTLSLFGRQYRRQRSGILSRLGCLIEKPDFYKYLTALQNLLLLARASGVRRPQERAMELMNFVGLEGRYHDKVSSFSHGMRQRLGLAQCLLHDPELIILDEPGTGLDPQGILDMREMILTLNRQQGKTIILSSHQLSEVEAVATDLVLINHGRVLVQGGSDVLLASSDRKVRIKVLDQAADLAALGQSAWAHLVQPVEKDFLELSLSQEQIPALLRYLIQKGSEVMEVESRQKLEDFYLNIVQKSSHSVQS